MFAFVANGSSVLGDDVSVLFAFPETDSFESFRFLLADEEAVASVSLLADQIGIFEFQLVAPAPDDPSYPAWHTVMCELIETQSASVCIDVLGNPQFELCNSAPIPFADDSRIDHVVVRVTNQIIASQRIVQASWDFIDTAARGCTPPSCAIANGLDCDGSGVLDGCEPLLSCSATGPCAPTCPADLDSTGNVGFGDLVGLLLAWGTCDGGCTADLDCSNDVGFADLTAMLIGWGACE